MGQQDRRLLLVFLNTGGGHHSVASAVAEALRALYDKRVQIDLVDVTADYMPWPLSELDSIYNQLVRLKGWPWALTYHLSDGPRRVALLKQGWWPLTRAALLQLLNDHPADAIVCCHPLLKDPILQALDENQSQTPMITLMTDLIGGHAFWFVPGDTYCLVPTEDARQRALSCGLSAERIQVTGLPVSPSFVASAKEDPQEVRRRLGLETDLPLVLLTSGAGGMGCLHRLCRAIADSGARAQLVTITGRNKRLHKKLAAETWPLPVRVEGFVHNMHEWMRAADLLVTRASPSTISEALVMELPMVLSGALPGQEPPNVDYVVKAGAGIWAPTSRRAARVVRDLLTSDDAALTKMATRAQALAQPEAAWRVAETVWASANGKLA